MSSGLQAGTIFAGRYKILRLIAQGGMGAVYEVMHLETARRRALKVMHPHILQSDALRERFKLEAKVAAQIESDFIVDVFDAGIDDATQMPFLVMELLRGEELGKRLLRLGRLPPEEVVSYLHQTALALDKTHKASIVHRDLKPENLFLTEREDSPPRIKVLDFGIAKIVAESATSGGPTQSLGTPLYMSPEQFNPSAKLSGTADIYALGMIAYTLLVGASYWEAEAQGGNIFALAAVAIHGPPQPASVRAAARGVSLPPAFDPWFARMTAVNPAYRYPTATLAVRALAEVFNMSLPMASGSLGQSGVSLGQSGASEPVSHRPVFPSAPGFGAPPTPPASSTEPYPTPGGIAMQPPGLMVPPAAGPMPFAGPPALQPPAHGVRQAPARMAPPTTGPGTTSLEASMSGAVSPAKGKGVLLASALALCAAGIGGAVFYVVRAQHAMATASPGGPMQMAPPAASAEAKAPSMTIPSAAPSTSPSAVPPAAPAPEPTPPASVMVASSATAAPFGNAKPKPPAGAPTAGKAPSSRVDLHKTPD